MNFEYSPEKAGPDMASAEALQQIAIQLERIADEVESEEVIEHRSGGLGFSLGGDA